MHSFFIEGLAVGFCLAAPVGPIAVLCLQRTTADGKLAGIATGLGAALADAFYGTLAALGITAVSSFLADHRNLMLRAGGLVLIVLGTRLLLAKRAEERSADPDGLGLVRDFLSSLALTLTNPITFVAFAAVFTALGIHVGRHHPLLTLELVLGVFAGSGAWWLVLVGLATVLRGRIRDTALVWVDRVVGTLVIFVGVLYLTGVAGAFVQARLPNGGS